MAVISVSGVPVGAPSSITLPLTGRPWADLTLAQPSVPWKPGDLVDVMVQGGGTYRMTVERVGPRGGFARVRLVSGTGGLSQEISAKYYHDIPAEKVIREILEECGEAAGTIQLPGKLPSWTRAAGPAHEALRAVMMRFPERLWQVAPDGKVNVGVAAWKDFETPVPVESEDAAAGTFTAQFTPALLAGLHVKLSRGEEEIGKRVTRVTHTVQEVYDYPKNQVQMRTIIGTGDGEDQGVTGLDASIQRAVRWVDYLALFDAEVIRDHGDHTLDLRPYHPLLPELTKVRLVQPMPGAKIKLKAGGVVLLSFQRGDPSRPLVLHYGSCELEKVEVITGRGQILRLDDDRGQKSPDDSLYQRPHALLQDAAGQKVELWAQAGQERVRVTDRAGQELLMDSASGQVILKATTTLTLDAPVVNVSPNGNVNLAGGALPVGRETDPVSGGIILKGSLRVRSG